MSGVSYLVSTLNLGIHVDLKYFDIDYIDFAEFEINDECIIIVYTNRSF